MDDNQNDTNLLVSLGVVARNAEQTLPELFERILAQTYPLQRIQLILVDSMSTDSTRTLMTSFANESGGLCSSVDVVENPGVLLAPGCNVMLEKAVGDVIVRLDAHMIFFADFIQRNVENILSGESISCGRVENRPANESAQALVANLAEDSLFGGSLASFRHSQRAGYVSTGAFAMYRRGVFEAVGQYDERLARTEDNEMHYRMNEAGYRFYFDPAIRSFRKTRATVPGLLKQKYLNGFWIGVTLHVEPKCFSLYHFVPAGFVLALLLCAICACCGFPQPLAVLLLLYVSILLVISLFAIVRSPQRPISAVLLPFWFFLLHVGYGIGTIVGCVTGPSLLKEKN